MKNISSILIPYILFFGFQSIGHSQTICEGQTIMPLNSFYQCDENPWVLVFEDNFNGSELDQSTWGIPYQGVIRDFYFENSKHWFANTGNTPPRPVGNNITLNNGTIKLITRKEQPAIEGTYVTDWSTNPPTTHTEYFDYSSAEISTKWNFHYGKIEARIKIPKGKGFWPAFWTFGANPWNELDVFEFWNEKNSLGNYDPSKLSKVHHMTAHYDYDNDGNTNMCEVNYTGTDFSQDFHTFAMVWEPNKIEWYVDGVLKRTDHRYYTMLGQTTGCLIQSWTQYIKNIIYPVDPMNIIFGIGIQHGDNNDPDGSTPFPSQLEIDWIRLYQRNACEDLIISDYSQFPLIDDIYNVMVGTNVEINCDYKVNSDEFLKVLSKEAIILKAGFNSQIGSEFLAKIDPSICDIKPQYDLSSTKLDQIDKVDISGHQINKSDNEISNNLSHIQVYPNPSMGIYNLELENLNKILNVKVFDKNKNLVFETEDVRSSKLTIDLTGYLRGYYYMQIIQEDTVETIRLFKY